MKKSWLILIVALLIFTPQLIAEDKAEAETRTLTGAYEWSARGSGGELEAVFTPTGEKSWDVSFHFKFRGEEHTYSGTAEGGSVPSEQNAIKYFIDTYRWAEEENIEIFWFSSFDEAWKVDAEGDVGAYWGLWDKDGNPKYF